ncbi:asparagine synthase-related protein, partial [Rhodococcus chondri]
CPAELKLASGGKGVLKEASRALRPAEIIDRPKGYFPVPGIRHLDGELLDMVHEALTGHTARQRSPFDPAAVAGLLADPNGNRTTLGSNALWQVALLELWLQTMDGIAAARPSTAPPSTTRQEIT